MFSEYQVLQKWRKYTKFSDIAWKVYVDNVTNKHFERLLRLGTKGMPFVHQFGQVSPRDRLVWQYNRNKCVKLGVTLLLCFASMVFIAWQLSQFGDEYAAQGNFLTLSLHQYELVGNLSALVSTYHVVMKAPEMEELMVKTLQLRVQIEVLGGPVRKEKSEKLLKYLYIYVCTTLIPVGGIFLGLYLVFPDNPYYLYGLTKWTAGHWPPGTSFVVFVTCGFWEYHQFRAGSAAWITVTWVSSNYMQTTKELLDILKSDSQSIRFDRILHLYNQMQILTKVHNDVFVTSFWCPMQMIFGGAIVVGVSTVLMHGAEQHWLHSWILAVGLLVTSVAAFFFLTFAAKMHEKSKNLKHALPVKLTKLQLKKLKAYRSLAVKVGSAYFVDKGCPLTYADILIQMIISMMLSAPVL